MTRRGRTSHEDTRTWRYEFHEYVISMGAQDINTKFFLPLYLIDDILLNTFLLSPFPSLHRALNNRRPSLSLHMNSDNSYTDYACSESGPQSDPEQWHTTCFVKRLTLLTFISVSLAGCLQQKSDIAIDDTDSRYKLSSDTTLEPETENDNFYSFDTNGLAVSSDSIWPRIRKGFALNSAIGQPAVQAEINWLARNPAYIDRVMQRADPFIYYITEEAEKRGLPTELVLLPVVESAYQPFAYSHGRAAGLWQFIPSTGRMYGLKQNWWYDGRRDIHASTQAALDYLQQLNTYFKGDWLLALAAYNSGAGTVQRAIKHNRQQQIATDFWHLKLPKETRAYVPKLLALKEIIEHPQQYNISLRCIANAPGFVQVKTRSQIDLALAAKLAGIELEDLYSYNPAFNRWATDPDGPHAFILPAEAATTFKQNYAKLTDNEHLKWVRHKIKTGETLSHIAVKYNTSVTHLRDVNDLKGNNIRDGKYILIPVASRERSDYTLSATQRTKTLQNKSRSNTSKLRHTVKSGESFWTIARKYKVDMHKLARWNGLAIRDPLKPGQKLTVWQKNGSSKPAGKTAKSSRNIQTISYTVKSGDSLARIASRYNVKVKDLHRWNTIKGKYIQPGQRLKLHVDVTEQSGNRG